MNRIDKGIRLGCLYSYGCNGTKRIKTIPFKEADSCLLRIIRAKNVDLDKISKIISSLDSYPFYINIARRRGEAVFPNSISENVVRSFWLGKEVAGNDNFVRYTHNFSTLGKIKVIKGEGDKHLQDKIVDLLLDCAISFAKVILKGANSARVLNHGLICKNGTIIFNEDRQKTVDIKFLDGVKRDDLVSVHLDIARERISQAQAENLKKITLKALELLK